MSTLRIGEKTHEVPEEVRKFVSDLVEAFSLQEDIIIQVKIAVSWMVKTLRHATDELHEGNYSDELKHAISVKELLEKI